MAARQPEFIIQALAELRKRRPCRSCGRPFRPDRIDALTCSETCRWRRSHGQPDYIDSLNTEQAVHDARQFHAHIESLLKEVQAHTAAERVRRRKRRAAEAAGAIVLERWQMWTVALWIADRITQATREGREISTEAILAEVPAQLLKDIPVTDGELKRIIEQVVAMKRSATNRRGST